jgi:hypothetical protein
MWVVFQTGLDEKNYSCSRALRLSHTLEKRTNDNMREAPLSDPGEEFQGQPTLSLSASAEDPEGGAKSEWARGLPP